MLAFLNVFICVIAGYIVGYTYGYKAGKANSSTQSQKGGDYACQVQIAGDADEDKPEND